MSKEIAHHSDYSPAWRNGVRSYCRSSCRSSCQLLRTAGCFVILNSEEWGQEAAKNCQLSFRRANMRLANVMRMSRKTAKSVSLGILKAHLGDRVLLCGLQRCQRLWWMILEIKPMHVKRTSVRHLAFLHASTTRVRSQHERIMFNSEARQGNSAKLLRALNFFPKGRCRRGWGAGKQTTDKEADSKTERTADFLHVR